MRLRFSLTALFALAGVLLVAAPVSADHRQPIRHQAVLRKVNIDHDWWLIAVQTEYWSNRPRRPCLIVAFSISNKKRGPYGYAGAPCGLPAFGGEEDSADSEPKEVLAFAFPRDVARVTFQFNDGERSSTLALISKTQARDAGVARFNWGYLKLIGPSCLKEYTGYDVNGEAVVHRSPEREEESKCPSEGTAGEMADHR